jgi:hypothetical protein
VEMGSVKERRRYAVWVPQKMKKKLEKRKK